MAYKDKSAAIRYNNQFNERAYDRINLTVKKGKKAELQTHAEKHKESLNAFINRAIDETIERDNKKADPIQQEPTAAEPKTEENESDTKSNNWQEDFAEAIKQDKEQQAAVKSAKQKAQTPKTWTTPDKLSREQTEEIMRKWLKDQGMDDLL